MQCEYPCRISHFDRRRMNAEAYCVYSCGARHPFNVLIALPDNHLSTPTFTSALVTRTYWLNDLS